MKITGENGEILWIIDDTLIRKVNDKVIVLRNKFQIGDDIYINRYLDVKAFVKKEILDMGSYIEVEGSGTKIGKPSHNWVFVEDGVYIDTVNNISYMVSKRMSVPKEYEYSGSYDLDFMYTIHNNSIYTNEFWIPDTVVYVDINMEHLFKYRPTVHLGKKVKDLKMGYIGKIVNDDAVNTSLEKLTVRGTPVIKLRNCVNLDYIDMPNDNVDFIDFYVDKKYKSLSKKKWTHDNCLVTDYRWMVNNRPLEKIDWKGLFNRSISNEADNYMCVQTDEAVVQIPLYMVQDGQSIDVDNALLIKEDDGVYYCPVTKEKTDKSIMAIQSTDCVYYIDSE